MFCHLLPLPALQIFAYEDAVLFYSKERTPQGRGKPKPERSGGIPMFTITELSSFGFHILNRNKIYHQQGQCGILQTFLVWDVGGGCGGFLNRNNFCFDAIFLLPLDNIFLNWFLYSCVFTFSFS